MKIKSITIKNFFGIASTTQVFNDEKTIFKGENGASKTTLMKAYLFALGINQPEFEPVLKPCNVKIGTNDKPITTEVELLILQDGLDYKLKRINKQNWKINKNTQIIEFVGNVSEFYFDSNVAITATLYKDKVANLLNCSYLDLEIIADITTFNTDNTKWKWDNRRKWLFEKLNIETIIKNLMNKDEYSLILNDLLKSKDDVDIQKELNKEKMQIKIEQDKNLILIEDKMNNLLEYSHIDFDKLQLQYDKLDLEKTNILISNNNENQNTILAQKQALLEQLQKQIINGINDNHVQEINLELNKNKIKTKINASNYGISSTTIKNKELENDIDKMNLKIENINNTPIEKKEICNECGQNLPQVDIDNYIENIGNKNKQEINNLKIKIDYNNTIISENINILKIEHENFKNLTTKLTNLNEDNLTLVDVNKLKMEILMLENDIHNLKLEDINKITNNRLLAIKDEMSLINIELGKKNNVININNTIDELRQKSLALSSQDKLRIQKQLQLKNYIIEKVSLIDNHINNYFEDITFNFFDYNNANANEEFSNTCTAMYKGIPYTHKLSTGEKMLVDIQVNKGLQKILNVDIPIWMDYFESITLPTTCTQQFIGLQVAPNTKIDGVVYCKDVYILADCLTKKEMLL